MEYRTREQWGATYDVNRRPVIKLPVADLFIHHNVMQPSNDPNADMRATEDVGVARFGYPSYSWGIHPFGVVLEGMTNHLSAHTAGHNSTAMAIMFMGNFENDVPTDAAMSAGQELIVMIRGWGWLAPVINLRGHRDVYTTACPGANLYPRIGDLLIPTSTTGDDMTPGQCRDIKGRKWHFYVDDDGKCSSFLAGKPNGRLLANDPGWTSGFDAYCDVNGEIAVCGRNRKGELAQIVFTPGGKPALYNVIGGHIYPR